MAESDFFGNQGFLESTARNLPPSTAVGLDVQGQPSSTGVAQGETLPRETLPKQPRFDYVHFVTFLGLRGIRIFPIEDVELKQSSHERQAGRGVSMSVVYGEVRDGENVRKPVAVKRAAYLGGQHSAAQGAAHDTWLLDLFFELQIMVHPSIQASNNIVRLLGIAFDDRDSDAAQPLAPWVIVEPAHEAFINLRGYFESQQRPATKQLSTACSLIADAADGLAILHVHSVIHGDVKPDNILIFPAPSGDGVMAKICDFGFSSISNPEDHDERRPLGLTRDWAAPEHDSGKGPPAFAQDVYSFGLVVAYIVLSGRRHLQELIDQADYSPVRLIDEIKTCLSRHPEDIADCPIDIRERIVALAQQCLARRPEDRPKSLESVRGFLCRADGQLDEGGTLRETVVPLPKSISSMAPESAHTDVTLARVYQGMKTASGKLPKWLRDRLVEQVEETLAHHQSDSEGPLGVKGGIDQRQRIQAAETALWTLHTLGTGSPPLAIPGYIDLADSGKRHELFAKLYRRQPSRFVLDNPLEEIRQFAEKAPTHGHAVADDGTSLYLHVAVYRNSPDLISWLIGAGASPDEMSPAGWSPLHVAVAMLHETCAAVLLDSGCNPNLPSRTQHGPQATPLATLVREGQIMAQAREADPKLRKFRSIYNLLIDRNADPWMTNVPGHHEPVSFMRMDGPLSAGVMSVVLDRHPMLANARDRSMETPIMRAAINGNLGVMRELLAHGADIEAADIVGYRTLHKLWNNMIDVKTIESRYWPFQSDLRPDSMRRRQAMTPIAQMRAAHDLLVSRGAGQGPSTGISSDTPAQSGFSNLRNILGPDRTCSLVASRIFSFRDVILYRHRGWLKEVVTINSVHPNGWLFRKLEPGELETLECLAREPKELQILRPTRHPSVVQLHICGAFPLDVAWPYYLVIRLGKIASMGEFQIRIRLTDVTHNQELFDSDDSRASFLLPRSNSIETALFGPVVLGPCADLTLHIETKPFGPSMHGGLILVDAQFQIAYADWLLPETVTASARLDSHDISRQLSRDVLQSLEAPGPDASPQAVSATVPWLDLPLCWKATRARLAAEQSVAKRSGPPVDRVWNAMPLQALLGLSQTQRWTWRALWWMYLVGDRSESESIMIRDEGLHHGLAAWAGRYRLLYDFRFYLHEPYLVHWALHHGCKVGAAWATHVWGVKCAGVSSLVAWVAGISALALVRWRFGSTSIVHLLLSRAAFSSGPASAWPGLSLRGCVLDNEWLWHTACHLGLWFGGPAARPRAFGVSIVMLAGALVVDLIAGKGNIWDLVLAVWQYSRAAFVVMGLHFHAKF